MKNYKTDVYQDVTSKIIEALERGVSPWVCPWIRAGEDALPVNHATGDHYRGINVLLLWLSQVLADYRSTRWMTYRQAAALGGQVKKGEKGTGLVFYKPIEKSTGEFDGDGNEVIELFPLIKPFTVFNLEQIEGFEIDQRETPAQFDPLESAEAVLQASGVTIRYGGDRAYYRPSSDDITLPEPGRFSNPFDFYATAMHELSHATSHERRCGRIPFQTDIPKGSYAFEELVAEIGASFCMAWLGLDGDVQDHASYIDGWLQVLRHDKKAIFKASAEAQKAHQWIMTQAMGEEIRHIA
jgi:antirestriction protein ArdC